MASGKLVNIDSDNGLLHDGTKPLPESMLINHHWTLVHSPDGNVTGSAQDIYRRYEFKYRQFKIMTAISPRPMS